MGLLRSVPRLDRPRSSKLETIEGLPPNLANAIAGLPVRAALSVPARRSATKTAAVSAPIPAAFRAAPARGYRRRQNCLDGQPAAPG